MLFLRSPFIRVAITVVLLGIIATSIVFIKNILTSTWQGMQTESALYNKSPNCLPHADASEVDPSLSPCRDVVATVVAKPQETTVDHTRYHDYVHSYRLLTLQFANGQKQTVGNIYKDMWQSISIGDHISVTFWRGAATRVDANGYSSPLLDQRKWSDFGASLMRWGVTILLCCFLISLVWNLGRRALVFQFPM